MLFGKPFDSRQRMLEDKAMAVEAAGVRGERLRAGVDDAALGAGAADDGRIDMQRAILERGNSGGDLHAIVVDISAWPVLSRAVELAEILQVRRAAGRDDRRLQPRLAQTGAGFVEKSLRLRPAGLGRVQH